MVDIHKPNGSSSESVQTVHLESQKKTRYSIRNSWSIFTATEKRNIIIYILGIMLYKFGIEAFNGSMIALATSRYDREARLAAKPARTFERVGLLTGLNQACQCLGSMLVTPLIRKNPTKTVISGAVLAFGVLTAVLLIVDASTGGTIKPRGWDKTHTTEDLGYYGTYNTDIMIPFYCFTGLAYGMVETIRRVIPKDIVGGDIQKLLRMDSIVHIFYEVSGTGGALTTSLVLIPYLGNNMSFIITPILLAAASTVWRLITAPPTPENEGLKVASLDDSKRSVIRVILEGLLEGVVVFFKSLALGITILFSSRRYIWLLPGYSLALYSHRFLENNISTVIAQRYLGDAAWSQIMVAGSNFGELLGALFVFLFTTLIHTPLPWIRLDSIILSIVWFLAFWRPAYRKMSQAWVVAGAFAPLSFGWAAGDVSLVAYVQSQLQGEEERSRRKYDGISPLSAVMSCLYSTYIVLYAIMSPLLGSYIDDVYKRRNDVHEAVKYVAGVQFSVIAGVILVVTFVPKGSFAFNPKKLNGDIMVDGEETQDEKQEGNEAGPADWLAYKPAGLLDTLEGDKCAAERLLVLHDLLNSGIDHDTTISYINQALHTKELDFRFVGVRTDLFTHVARWRENPETLNDISRVDAQLLIWPIFPYSNAKKVWNKFVESTVEQVDKAEEIIQNRSSLSHEENMRLEQRLRYVRTMLEDNIALDAKAGPGPRAISTFRGCRQCSGAICPECLLLSVEEVYLRLKDRNNKDDDFREWYALFGPEPQGGKQTKVSAQTEQHGLEAEKLPERLRQTDKSEDNPQVPQQGLPADHCDCPAHGAKEDAKPARKDSEETKHR
ncbi:hypothetical protein IFR05_009154 [Cadophora sp. M221]|nr:hypothetical protein IFR05_009154 [Cadophora sp. M221]